MTPPALRARRPRRRVRTLAAAVTAAAASTLGVAGPAAASPLDSGVATPTASWAVVAMGRLDQPLNTFWQLLVRPAGAARWTLVTPPGVADNGGLVAAVPPGGGPVTAGIEPSQLLEFSPLARSADLGRSWAPALLPQPLAPVPDALASSASGGADRLLALSRRAGGTVLSSAGGWHTVTTRGALARGPAHTCRPSALTAVASFADGALAVGAHCAQPGASGLFVSSRTVSPSYPPTLSMAAAGPPGSSDVVRVTRTASDLVAVVTRPGSRGTTWLTTLWHPATSPAGSWSTTASLSLPRGAALRSTAATTSGGALAIVRTRGGGLQLYQATPPRAAWQRLPTPPSGTSTVAPVGAGEVDAFVVDYSRLTVYRLAADATSWQQLQRMSVPIVYGSSG